METSVILRNKGSPSDCDLVYRHSQRGSLDFAPKYNSQELDRETNFYFYNARYYDPEIGRFTSADSVIDGNDDTQGWNRFSYVKGNPVLFRDPTGHWSASSLAQNLGEGAGEIVLNTGEGIYDAVTSPVETIKNAATRKMNSLQKNPGREIISAVPGGSQALHSYDTVNRIAKADSPLDETFRVAGETGAEAAIGYATGKTVQGVAGVAGRVAKGIGKSSSPGKAAPRASVNNSSNQQVGSTHDNRTISVYINKATSDAGGELTIVRNGKEILRVGPSGRHKIQKAHTHPTYSNLNPKTGKRRIGVSGQARPSNQKDLKELYKAQQTGNVTKKGG
ncbi:RHS repeat-associated core domain-containing protein [Leptospira wolffii]|uniref:RHS repeat-associated core domain-containing protein n=1 Tax=Leptospira wolffii TaxID=409998 RepID=UPI00405557A3